MSKLSHKELGKNHIHITVDIASDELKSDFEKALKEQAQKAQVDGFRPGKVPLGLVKKMKGNIIFTQILFDRAEKQITHFVKENNYTIIGQALMTKAPEDIQHQTPTTYSFEFELGLQPQFTLSDLSKLKLEKPVLSVTDAEIDEEVEKIRLQLGRMDEENIEVKTEDDSIQIEITIDEHTIKQQEYIRIANFVNTKELIGKQVGYQWNSTLEKTIEKTFLETLLSKPSFNINPQIKSSKASFMVTQVYHIVPAELNEDFFKKISPNDDIKSLDDLKKLVKESIQKGNDQRSNNFVQNQIYVEWMKNLELDFPIPFLKNWYAQTQQHDHHHHEHHDHESHDHHHHEPSPEKFDSFLKQLKWTTISSRISEDKKIQVDQKQLMAKIESDIYRYNPYADEKQKATMLRNLINNKDYLFDIQHKLMSQAVLDWASSQTQPNEVIVNKDAFLKKEQELEKEF